MNQINTEQPIIDRRQHHHQPITCGLQSMPIQEVLQHIQADAKKAHAILKVTNSQDDIHIVLDKIQKYQVDFRVSQQIKDFINILRNKASALSLHDITRDKMCELLQQLIAMLEEEISHEKHNEFARHLNELFTLMAKHSDEIATWCEQSGISLF